MATGASDHTIRFWDTRELKQASPPVLHSDAVTSLSWSADGKLLAFGSKDKSVHLLDPKSPERRTQLRFHDDSVDWLGLSADGGELASVSRELGLELWSLASLKTPSTLVERGNVLSFAFVPGKDELVSAGLGSDGVGIFNLSSGISQTRLPAGIERIRTLAVSSDGTRLAFAGSGAQVLLWDLPARIPLRVFDGPRDEVRAVAFSADNRWLGFAGLDRTLRVADTTSYALVAELDAGAALQALAFSGKSGLLFAGDRDGALSAWDVPGKRRLLRVKAHDDWLLGVAVSDDGERVASAAPTGTSKFGKRAAQAGPRSERPRRQSAVRRVLERWPLAGERCRGQVRSYLGLERGQGSGSLGRSHRRCARSALFGAASRARLSQ